MVPEITHILCHLEKNGCDQFLTFLAEGANLHGPLKELGWHLFTLTPMCMLYLHDLNPPSGEPCMFKVPARVSVTGSVIFRQAAILSSVGQPTLVATWERS